MTARKSINLQSKRDLLKTNTTNTTNTMNRLTKDEYGCLLTIAGKGRSEDIFNQVSSAAFDENGRVLGISYNGLAPGMAVPDWMLLEENRVKKSKLFIHAESNILNLIKRGECHTLYTNLSPCFSCSQQIISHNIFKVVYWREYDKCKEFKELFDFYNIEYYELSRSSKLNVLTYLEEQVNKIKVELLT